MQLCNPNATTTSTGYPDSVMETLARYPMVTFEKCVGTSTAGYEEDKVVASCQWLKSHNPNISCVFYLNTELDFTGFEIYDDFESHPEYWLMDTDDKPVTQAAPQWGCSDGKCPGDGRLKLADYSVESAATFWMSHCANVTASPYVDGCNLDRSMHLGNFTNTVSKDWKPRNGPAAFNDGKLAAMQMLQQVVGAGPVIANCHECLTDATTIPGVASQNLEGFKNSEEWIIKMQVLARANKLAKAHYSMPSPGDGCLNASQVEHAMAAFLMGAGDNAFFSCASGWEGVSAQGGVEPWVTWLPQYDKPLGKPLGVGVKDNTTGVWSRNFTSGTSVWFNALSNEGQICWKGDPGPCPVFPPTPSPSPAPSPAPVPPVPASCGQVHSNTGVGGVGSDMKNLEKVLQSAADCCAYCQNTSQCVMWAWHAEQKGECHLHTAKGVFTNHKGCFSGKLESLSLSPYY